MADSRPRSSPNFDGGNDDGGDYNATFSWLDHHPDLPGAGSIGERSNGGGAISGSVTDAAGSVIVGARLTLRNMATGSERQATADAHGEFRFPSLPPGEYQIEAEAPGFSKSIQSVRVRVGETTIVTLGLTCRWSA